MASGAAAFLSGLQKDSVEFDYVFDATQGQISPSACGNDHCWLFTENELQVFRLAGSSRGSRIFKWIFESPSGAEMTVRFATEVHVRGQAYLLVSLAADNGAGPEMRLLNLRTGQCETSLTLTHSGRALVASAAVQVPTKYATARGGASVIVGTDGGCLFAVDIVREEGGDEGEAASWRAREALLNAEQVEQRNLFKYRESVLAKQRSSVTAIEYIPELPGFAVGFSFSAFQLYAKGGKGYRSVGTSTLRSSRDAQPVVAFGFLQRGEGFLWVVRGSLPSSLARSVASAALFRIPDNCLEAGCPLEDVDAIYQRRFDCEVPGRTASSRLLHCSALPRRGEQPDHLLFAWEAVATFKGTTQTELHMEVFNLQAAAALDSSRSPADLECFTRFSVTPLALATGNFDVSQTALAALVLPSSVDDYSKRFRGVAPGEGEDMDEDMEMHGQEGGCPSLSVGFDVALLSTEGVTTYRLAGPVPAALEQLAAKRLDEETIREQFNSCLEAGLITGVDAAVAVEEQWRRVLGVLLDHSMVSVVCQYLVAEQHTLRPGLVYDWVQAEAAQVVARYSAESDAALDERRQETMDSDYTRLADCFSVMRALLALQPSGGGVTADTLRTLQFIEIHSWLSQLKGREERHQLEQQCYTMAQARKARKKPQKLFVERIMKSLKASIGASRGGDGDTEMADEGEEGFLASDSDFSYVYPVDLRRLVRSAAPEVMMTKRCLVFYHLLDLAAIDDGLANAPEEFADAFMLPNAYRKVVKSLWILDCADWESYLLAAQLLSEFWTDKRRHNEAWAQEILRWAGDILTAFLQDPAYRKAHLAPPPAADMEEDGEEGDGPPPAEGRLRAPVLFLYAAQPQLEERELEVALLAVLFGSNDPVQDGFSFQRRMLRRPLAQGQRVTAKRLLAHLFDFAQKRGLLDVLFLLHLDELEEQALVEFFTTSGGLDYLFVYYLQRCRYQEAFQVDQALTAAGAHSEERALLLDNVRGLVSPFQQSASFARLHGAVRPAVPASSCAAKVVPGWTGPPAAAEAAEAEVEFSSFAPRSHTPKRKAASTPATLLLHGGGTEALGTGQRVNRFLQTPYQTPLGAPSTGQRSVKRQLASTPFSAGKSGARTPAGSEPMLSPFLGTPGAYHVPYGSTPDFTPAFDRSARPHDTLADDL
mmetsp:Transcript_8089/g.34042  ORF Transcript_8089/g.34042 Transcript_8089/m.34042 type:complete len:1162 (+) Transcript_8089:128-3613(+)|eukprot:CAMPEP_0114620316 /NCGR_PEP_ID=MMETSP0168-20121206/8663_1 /TAXON_ID=95228 ORGANISM="Vannella sp., Strain DIVA3 517/6/12" /NCGR_SAMPLE_ID=MMETSP0168 /ASSEMBLY_ACC=CAM_ASM_000044 /LENGTH=1161 /DNA_ID=CAMNT_0001831505 /DNA_START=57 /DNA_END=3542 /DNA_ORIENTATION=+